MKRFTLQRVDAHGVVLETVPNLVGRLLAASPPFGQRIMRCDPRFDELPFVQWIHQDGGHLTTWKDSGVEPFVRRHDERHAAAQPEALPTLALLASVPPQPTPPPSMPEARVLYAKIQFWCRNNLSGAVEVRELEWAYVDDGQLFVVGELVRLHRYGASTPAASDSIDGPDHLSMFAREDGVVVGEGVDFVCPKERKALHRSTLRWDYFVGSPIGPPQFRLGERRFWAAGWRRVEWDYRLTDSDRRAGLARVQRAVAARSDRLARAERLRMGSIHALGVPKKRAAPAESPQRKQLRRRGWR